MWLMAMKRCRSFINNLPTQRRCSPQMMSGCMWATMFICFMLALTLTSTANTLIVLAVAPLLTTLLAWAVLKAPRSP